jgi:hypothetical protein
LFFLCFGAVAGLPKAHEDNATSTEGFTSTGCVPSCARENLSVSNYNQLKLNSWSG